MKRIISYHGILGTYIYIYRFEIKNNILKVTLPDAQKRKGQNSWHIFYHAWSFFDLGSIFLLPRFFLRTIGMYILDERLSENDKYLFQSS